MKILSLGAGNMASALLRPMAGQLDEFLVFTPTFKKAKALASFMGGRAIEQLDDLEDESDFTPDYLFLAFKPQQFTTATESFLKLTAWERWKNHTTIVSMLAGTPLEVLEKRFGTEKVIRIMPNTPALVGKGITLICPSKEIDNENLFTLKGLLQTAGPTYQCKDEVQLDDVTAVTGSGPAYVFEITRILQDFLISKGVEAEDARDLAVNLLTGASELMDADNTELIKLRENVTSKNGVTEAALNSLKASDLEGTFIKALEKNIERSFELRSDALKIKP